MFAEQRTSFESLATEIQTEIWADLPRQTKSSILQVCKAWKERAMGIPYLWTDFSFGPGLMHEDLAVARRWLGYSVNAKISASIDSPLLHEVSLNLLSILELLAPESPRLHSLSITLPDSHAHTVHSFLVARPLPALSSLSVMLEHTWLSVITHDNRQSLVQPFQLLLSPMLTSLHLANVPIMWPASAMSLTEVVLGTQNADVVPSFFELKQALEALPALARLGFYREPPNLQRSDLAGDQTITLPTVTSLSIRQIRPEAFHDIIHVLNDTVDPAVARAAAA
ncbi:hypothetical protein GGX14DRAFT_391236 [Mycena pura]|uniref:F-box domain-containing protein n=1 Tax=Mycena pura TaxID=153505 RepID=A0AAD6VL97_9AGAR|nr:hypothetical protein GGX14DRAFT_391236 [Mycena pura]